MAKPRHDRLLAALIAKLPPATAPWRCEERIAWLRMMAMAFDVVYGACAAVPVAPSEPQASAGARSDAAAAGAACDNAAMGGSGAAGDGVANSAGLAGHAMASRATAAAAIALSGPTPCRFYVDHDGFAMGDGKPIAMEDLPEGAILWDERSGLECGDLTTILWRDIGATRRGLPHGVILKAAMGAT